MFIIKKGKSSYNGCVYFNIKYSIEKMVTVKSKLFSLVLNVFVYARYNKYIDIGKDIKTISKSNVSNIFIFITDIILQKLFVDVCRKKKLWVKKKKEFNLSIYTMYCRFLHIHIYIDYLSYHVLF